MEEIFHTDHTDSTHTLGDTEREAYQGWEITLSRLPPYVTTIRQIMLHASSAQKIGPWGMNNP